MIAVNITGNRIDETPLLGQLVQGQAYLERIVFFLPATLGDTAAAGLCYHVRLRSMEEGTVVSAALDKTVAEDGAVELGWQVSEDFTALSGPAMLEISGTDSQNKVQYRGVSGLFTVIPNLGIGENLPPKSEMEEMLEETRENVIKAQNAADQAAEEAYQKILDLWGDIVIEQLPVTDNLRYTEDGKLDVNTAPSVEQDNTRPVTSAAVYTEVGNIAALLATI